MSRSLVVKLGLLAALFFLVIAGFLGFSYFQLNKPLLVNERNAIVDIKPAETAHNIITDLYKKKLITFPFIVEKTLVFRGLARKLKTGVYKINPNESVLNFLERVIAGDVLQLNFSIIEGSKYAQVLKNISTAPYLSNTVGRSPVLRPKRANNEGLLLADTYQYDAGSDSAQLLNTANTCLLNYLAEVWQHRDLDLPYKNSYELLIAASILEKETALATERRLIAGVISNRLKKRMPLQMDPTVIYGLGERYKGNLTHQDMQDDSPYNTYKYRGLPPTPIAIVGKQSLWAAAHPEPTNYLYFVAKGDGSHVFSETYTLQKAAIKNLLRKK